MNKSHNILITGASGFVGANVTRDLLKHNYTIHILLRKNANTWRIDDILPKVTVHLVDLSDVSSLTKCLSIVKPDVIFHLAAYGAYEEQDNLAQMIQTNIIGLSNLLEASKDIPYKVFVNTGSSSEYGYKKKPMKELDLLEPNSYYAATKAAATHIATVFAQKNNKPVITFRLFSVYGPFEQNTRLIPSAILSLLKNRPFALTSGTIKRDFVYVEDVVDAYVRVMKKKITPGNIVNIGTGKQYSIDTIAKTIKKISGNALQIKKGAFPTKSWDTSYWVADAARAKHELGWQAKTSLIDGLTKTYAWFVNAQERYKSHYV